MIFFVNPNDVIREKLVLLNLVNKLTGWDKFGAKPYIDTIRVIHTDNKEEDINFYELFYRFPPFEPITYPETEYNGVKFVGDRLWVLDVNEMFSHGRLRNKCRRLKRSLNLPSYNDYSIVGLIRGDKVKLTDVVVFRIIGDLDGSLTLRFIKNNRYYVFQYGFSYDTIRFIKEKICREIGCIQGSFRDIVSKDWNKIREFISQVYRPRYDINVLNYITYCYNGRYITTDPLIQYIDDKYIICPPCRNRKPSGFFICKDYPGLGIYHYSRKVFPRVYVDIEPEVVYFFKIKESPLTIDLAEKIRIDSKVSKLTIYLPRDNILELTPKIKPYTDLVRTRGLVLYTPQDFIKALISFIEDTDQELLKILVTKYVVYETSLFRLRPVITRSNFNGILLNRDKRIEFNADERPLVELVNKMLSRRNIYSEKFVDFVGSVLMHTLSHLLIVELSKRLSIDLDKLAYVYGSRIIPSGDKIYFLAIVEKDKYGTIVLDKAIRELLESIGKGDYRRGLYKLLKEIHRNISEALNEYSRVFKQNIQSTECSNIYSDLDEDERKVLDAVIDVISETRDYLKRNNVYPDFSIFKQLIVSLFNAHNTDVYSHIINWIKDKLSKEIKDTSKVEEILEDIIERKLESLIICYGPDYCYDGCNLDIHLGKDCSKPIIENLETSRKLFSAFIQLIGLDEGSKASTVRGITVYRIITTARKSLEIETSHTNDQAIDALANILKRGVKVHITIDKRMINEVKDKLLSLKNKYGDQFVFSEARELMHNKTYTIDGVLLIESTWNYSTASSIKQKMIVKNILVQDTLNNN